MAEPQREHIVLSGDKQKLGETLSALRDYVGVVSTRAGVTKAAMHKLKLAVDEIATNIILYGYATATPDAVLDVESVIEDDKLTIVLEDSGAAYDPTKHDFDEELLDNLLEDRPIGGLGVFLAFRSVDEFGYTRVGDRNQNRFMIRRTETMA